MRRKTLYVMTGVFAAVFIIASIHAQDEMLVVDNTVFEDPQSPPALFQHDEHNEKAGIDECNECHHVYEDGELQEYDSSEDQLCSECHTFEASDNRLPLMKAFHQNCKGCHKEQKSGPIMCGECHRKGNKA